MPLKKNLLDQMAQKATVWIGSPSSIILHTVFFIVMLALIELGFNANTVMLVLTTIVSLEAIYLAIFIQYSINQQDKVITEVAEDIDEVSEDVEEISKDVEEISKDVEDISEDVEEISKDIDVIQAEAEKENLNDTETYARIENQLKSLLAEINALKKKETAKLKNPKNKRIN